MNAPAVLVCSLCGDANCHNGSHSAPNRRWVTRAEYLRPLPAIPVTPMSDAAFKASRVAARKAAQESTEEIGLPTRRSTITEALSELRVARSQFVESDDPIIRGHVQAAIEILEEVGA